MPVVIALRNKNLKSYHWDQIKQIIGQDFDIANESFTLQSLLQMKVVNFMEQIQEIST